MQEKLIMILGIGTDIVEIKRIEDFFNKFGEKFYDRIFTENEILSAKKYKNDKIFAHFAKRFAAKEAFSKALGTGIGKIVNFLDIEIVNDKSGKPEIKLSDNKKDELKNFFGNNFAVFLSLSDEKTHAVAFVIIEKR